MTRLDASSQSPERKFWHLSIAHKLELAFGLIAALTVGATLLSLVRFNDVDAVIHRLTDSSLPAVKLSLGVEARTNELAIMGAQLGNVSDTTEMLDLIGKVGQKSSELWSTVGQLKMVLGEQSTFGRMETLITSVDDDLQKLDRFTQGARSPRLHPRGYRTRYQGRHRRHPRHAGPPDRHLARRAGGYRRGAAGQGASGGAFGIAFSRLPSAG